MPAFGRPASTTRNGRPVTDRASSCRAAVVELRDAARQPKQQVVAADEVNVLVGEIEGGLHVGEQVQQIFAQSLQGTGEAAGQLDQGLFQLAFVVGFHDRLHRLGPRQVQLAGQERPQRELPRPRGAGAGLQQSRR